MNLKEIKEMITLMNENELAELEIEKEGTKIRIKKAPIELPDSYRIAPPPYRIETLPVGNQPAEHTNSNPVVAAPPKTTKEIPSPMVGTFYRAPSPESAPFVEAGQIVEIGQVVCIVEAMKLMNEIKSEVKGKIVEIAVENAVPVEFGQTLFVVDPVY